LSLTDEWTPLGSDRVFRKHQDGFLVIRPVDDIDNTPIECPVCLMMMIDLDDSRAYSDYDCCHSCQTKWAEGFHREDWKNGWRPSVEDIEKEVLRRLSIPVTIRF